MAGTETKSSSKKVPIICFILCVVLGLFSSTLGGFFLLVSFISFLVCRMQDNVPDTGAMEGSNLTDWDLPKEEESDMFPLQPDIIQRGCPTSIDLAGEVEICPRGIGEGF